MRKFDRWLFGYGAPEAFGLFRLVMGSLMFINLCFISIDFDAWFTERGYVPVAIGERYMEPWYRFTLLPHVTSTPVTLAFYILVMVAALFTAIGLWSRVSTLVLALGLITLHHRNPWILHSGDTLMRMAAVYLAVGPSGMAFSVDRYRAVKKGTAEPNPTISMWPQRLVQIQIAVVYLSTVWWKMYGVYWRNLTASYFPTELHEFDRFWMPKFMDNNVWVVKVTTLGTLVVEIALGTLVFWKPARKYCLIGGLLLHGYIDYRFNIPLFSYIITSCYICFYEGDEVRAWYERLRNRRRRQALPPVPEAT